MYCKECGFNMGEGHIACPKCGTLVDFETNDKYGIDWNLNGKSKPMHEIEPIKVEPPKVEKPNEELPTTKNRRSRRS